MSNWELHEMDCRLAMSMLMEPNSVDAVVCDPPYGLSREPDMAEVMRHWLAGDDYTHTGSGFMGKSWDSFVPGPSVWREAYRVLKPGGYLVAFFGTRTYDMGVLALRLAGFEIRDQLAWVFGSGFPKSLDVSKAIDKAAGAEREIIGRSARHVSGKPEQRTAGLVGSSSFQESIGMGAYLTAPATDDAKQWQGWGTALKPAYEPIVLARKPLVGTVAANVLAHGTGALNIDRCRISYDMADTNPATNPLHRKLAGYANGNAADAGSSSYSLKDGSGDRNPNNLGRWPANLCHDGSDEVLAQFPTTSSGKMRAGTVRAAQDEPGSVVYGTYGGCRTPADTLGDSGSAARFYYCAKASKADRNEGCERLPTRTGGMVSNTSGQHMTRRDEGYDPAPVANHHPTVKPTDLMRWLVRLVTPPGGTVLDPFTGSGSTGKAAILEGFDFVGCEMTPEYAAIARARLSAAIDRVARELAASPRSVPPRG